MIPRARSVNAPRRLVRAAAPIDTPMNEKQSLFAVAAVLVIGLIGYIVYQQNQISLLQQRPAPVPAASPTVAKPAAAAAAAAPAAPVVDPRVLTADQRKTLIEKLGGPNSSLSNPVWFATAPNNPEAAAFQKQLQSAFEEAGWKIRGNVPVRFPIKPGIFVFSADEQPPNFVGNAVEALEGIGLTVTSGTGYREFYKTKKADNPGWIGFDMADDQAYVVVIGRKPEAKAEGATPTS